MSRPIIEVEKISKLYALGEKRPISLRESFERGWRNLFENSKNCVPKSAFWALKDISFTVEKGEIIGIIGRNGAGKSTLLKILSRITEPTGGKAVLRGRVSSLLEVGTGFHAELTGRENIYLNGAILGMRKKEIDRKLDEIIAFAEVEGFIDTPVKHYSSGMYVRLAFAVAAHLEQEILLVDEVLAVGDTAFQKKCLNKMEGVAKGGRTVFFVSHNLSAVGRLCQTGICLHAGKIKLRGGIASVLSAYQQALVGSEGTNAVDVDVADGEVRFIRWQLINSTTQSKHSCFSRDDCRFVFTVVAKRDIRTAFVGFAVWDSEDRLVMAANSMDNEGAYIHLKKGIHNIIFRVRLPIKAGLYQLDVSMNSPNFGQLDRWTADPKLSVLPRANTDLHETWHGLLNEEVKFEYNSTADHIF